MTDHWDVVWTPPEDERAGRDWDYDIEEELRDARQVQITVDGASFHEKLQRMLRQLSDRELTDLELSWLYLYPRMMDPFEMASEGTLGHLVQLPESGEVATTVAAVARFLLSVYCAAMEEAAERIERRFGSEGDQA